MFLLLICCCYGNVVIRECCYYGNVVITDMLLLHGIATDMLLVLIWLMTGMPLLLLRCCYVISTDMVYDWYATTIDVSLLLICYLD